MQHPVQRYDRNPVAEYGNDSQKYFRVSCEKFLPPEGRLWPLPKRS